MKQLGFALIIVGFITAAYFTSLHPTEVQLPAFLGALAAAVVGVAIVRTIDRRASRDESHIQASIETLSRSLKSIADKAKALDARKADVDVYDLRHEIEKEFPQDLDAFVESRESIAHSFGLQAYAEVMNEAATSAAGLVRKLLAFTRQDNVRLPPP